MKTNDKTLADAQAGGRVRLGDQRSDLVPGIVRCAKCAFQLHRTNLYVQSGTVGAGDSKTEPCPNGCGPLWPVTWETWAREGWAEAERLHLENAALSAQPCPGGQAAHCPVKHCGMTYARVPADGRCHACGATVQPSPGGQGLDPGRVAVEFIAAANFDVPDGYVVEEHLPGIWHYTYTDAGEKMASCASWNNKAHATIAAWQAALAARQPVGELHLPPDGFYKIVYDDAQVPDESFARTGALDAALRRFEQISARWNAHLFVRFAKNTRDCTVPNATPAKAVDLVPVRVLADHAAGRINHANNGLCPDEIEGHDTRDPDCPVCRALIDSQAVGNG